MEPEHSKKQKVLAKLHKRGLHFVLCRANKAALETGWQNKAASLDSVLKHYAAGGLLGFIPGRSGLWVLDVDKFPGEDKDTGDLLASCDGSALAALETIDTPRGRHAYFKKTSSNPIGNRAWAVGGYSGDIRADHGYIILWEPNKLDVALDMLPDATPTAVSLFPKPAKGAGLHLVEGRRNTALNELVFRRAASGQATFVEERHGHRVHGHRRVGLSVADEVEDATTFRYNLSAASCGDQRTFPSKDADAAVAALHLELVGTSNDQECLPNDPSGNTRFVPIQCGAGSHVEPYLDEHRVQLWAEGLAFISTTALPDWPTARPRDRGEPSSWCFERSRTTLPATPGLWACKLPGSPRPKRHRRHRRKDQVIEDAVEEIVGDGPSTIGDLCRLVGIPSSDRRAVSRLADALRMKGWTKKRERVPNGERVYFWRKQ